MQSYTDRIIRPSRRCCAMLWSMFLQSDAFEMQRRRLLVKRLEVNLKAAAVSAERRIQRSLQPIHLGAGRKVSELKTPDSPACSATQKGSCCLTSSNHACSLANLRSQILDIYACRKYSSF